MFLKCDFLFIFIFLLINSNIPSVHNITLPIKIKKDKIFYFYITLYYGEGNAPQDFILDTTNTFITSPCNLCETCGYHSNEWYNITDSENQILSCDNNKCGELSGKCENNQCSYRYDYYENAYIKGVLVNEKISFVKSSSNYFDIMIGCTLNETNYIIAQDSDGIIGLNNDENSFVNILYKSKIISKNLFTIYLNQDNTGYLSLGEIYNKNNLSKKINYVPFTIDEEKYYNLKIKSFEINDKVIDYKATSVIDTTATLCSFPNDLFDTIVKEFEEKCPENSCGKLIKNRNFGVCSIFKDGQDMKSKISNWFDITINFKDYKYLWKPANYWVDISTEHTFRACLGFERTEEKIITLGTTFLHGYDIIFDREVKKIGFMFMNPEGKNIYFNETTANKENPDKIEGNDNIIENNLKSNNMSSGSNYINNRINLGDRKEIKEIKAKKIIKIILVSILIIILIVIIIIIIKKSKSKKSIKKKKFRKATIIDKDKEKIGLIK